MSATDDRIAAIEAADERDVHRRLQQMRAKRDEAIAENVRLRELYENVTSNRERFGWTINHLLECEEALRTVESAAAEAIAERNRYRKALDRIAEFGLGHGSLREAQQLAVVALGPYVCAAHDWESGLPCPECAALTEGQET